MIVQVNTDDTGLMLALAKSVAEQQHTRQECSHATQAECMRTSMARAIVQQVQARGSYVEVWSL